MGEGHGKPKGDVEGAARGGRTGLHDECLRGGGVDAVFIAPPNEMHREYAVRAARAGAQAHPGAVALSEVKRERRGATVRRAGPQIEGNIPDERPSHSWIP